MILAAGATWEQNRFHDLLVNVGPYENNRFVKPNVGYLDLSDYVDLISPFLRLWCEENAFL